MPEPKKFPFSPAPFTRKQFFSFKAMHDLVEEIKESDEKFNEEASPIIEQLFNKKITAEQADKLYAEALDKAIQRRKVINASKK